MSDSLCTQIETALRSSFSVLGSPKEMFLEAGRKGSGHLSCWVLRDGSVVYARSRNHEESAVQVLETCGLAIHANSALELMSRTGAIRMRVHRNPFVHVILSMNPTTHQIAYVLAVNKFLPTASTTFLYEATSEKGMKTLAEGISAADFATKDWAEVFK